MTARLLARPAARPVAHPTAGAPVWPAAVSTLTAALVHGPARSARVAAVFPTAVYLLVDQADPADQADPVDPVDPAPRLVAVLAPGGLLLPVGLRLAAWPSGGWRLEPGDPVTLGGGRLELPAGTVRAVRIWRPARVRAGRTAADVSPAVAELLATIHPPEHLVGRARDVAAAALAGRLCDEHWASLVGAGPGLTPSGDDALCGALLAVHAWGRGVDPAAIARAYPRTTALSAALIDAARQGYAVPQLVALLDAVLAGDVAASTRRLPAVLAIGHSSGRDLVAGLLGAVRAATADPDLALPVPTRPDPVRSHTWR